MKIGIITFWNSQDNYGQLLQCFALQHYLKKKGHQPFLIRYIPQVKTKTKLERIASLWKLLSPTHINAYKKFIEDQKKSAIFDAKNPRYFDDFRAEHIDFSSSIYRNLNDLKNENWDADAFICGSDQIWSYSPIKENIEAFFLQFAPKTSKVIAYAASFGRPELPPDYLKMLPNMLNKFHAVGLREETGVTLCKKANRSDASLVCDPTLLLMGSDYIASIVKKEVKETNTVFTYLLNWETDFPLDEIKTIMASENLEMNFIGAHGMENRNLFPFFDDLRIASWLQKMASSKYSFTNSFHGTVLSILLKRSFVTFPLSGVSAKMNGRITTLLSLLGLEDRIYTPGKSIEEILKQPIDWDLVEEKLNAFRGESASFLEKSLQGE
jgi:hypothetical protein